MATTDLDVFMGKLNRLINDNGNYLISSNRLIKAKKPEIQLLHRELGYVIHLGLNNINTDAEQDVEDVENLKTRLMEVVQVAENAIDIFISTALLKVKDKDDLIDPECSLNKIMRDLIDIRIETKNKFHRSRMGKFLKKSNNVQPVVSESANLQVSETTSTKTTARVNPRATEHEQVIVGFDDDALSIMDRLTEDRKGLDIISIDGMGGLGKTTLASKIFNNPYIESYFHVRGWITASEAYARRDMLIGMLSSIGKSVHEATTEQKLCEMVYKSLKGRKYLIVIDDIWSAKAWDGLRLYFPDDSTGSRILLTTRLTDVAAHARPGSFTHHLQCLSEEKSWELLCTKTFRGYECPKSLIEIGKHIAKKCQGLPLALVVIAGVLEKGDKSKDMWEKVAESVSAYIADDPKGCLDTLALSYDHLPHHLRNCFLYVGGFPEDHEIQTQRMIRLWMAEGFIKESAQRSLEEQGEDYLMDLVDRNLLNVVNRRSDGGIKTCRMHDLLRELCLIKADELKFFNKVSMYNRIFSDFSTGIQRLFTDYKVLCDANSSHVSSTHIRSILCFSNSQQLKNRNRGWVPSFLLLRVLDILNVRLAKLSEISILIHLRYLAVWLLKKESLFTVRYLGDLQTLILKGKFISSSYMAIGTMSIMKNLRHLWSERIISIGDDASVLNNLQTLSRLRLHVGDQNSLRLFPNIKKLACAVYGTMRNRASVDLSLLTHLEALDMELDRNERYLRNPITLPETLKKLTLKGLRLPWSFMSTIQQLPKLEFLKLLDSSFEGIMWDAGDDKFCKLKFLKLQKLDIQIWEASSINFPQLRKLEVTGCKNLKGIPLEIGDISTLERIEIGDSNSLVLESVNLIQEEQSVLGNYDIHVKAVDIAPTEVFFHGDPFYE